MIILHYLVFLGHGQISVAQKNPPFPSITAMSQKVKHCVAKIQNKIYPFSLQTYFAAFLPFA